jgi:phage baseplate assembly protein W
MQINLTKLVENNPKNTGFLYNDFYEDLDFQTATNAFPYNKQTNKLDLQSSQDVNAVLNSFVNIMNTDPGEKLLNPLLGINFKKYLFAPITQMTLLQIAQELTEKVPKQDRRIVLKNVRVTGVPDENTVVISLQIVVPTLNNQVLPIQGRLTENGFTVTS